MSTTYRNGIRFRCIVTAWREEEVEGEVARVINSVERVVCVEVDHHPVETQSKRAVTMARALVQALYPQVNEFDVYNIVDEKESPAEVLGYVTGFGSGHQCYESNPIVAFRQEHNPAEYREPDAMTWEQERAEFRKRQQRPAAIGIGAADEIQTVDLGGGVLVKDTPEHLREIGAIE